MRDWTAKTSGGGPAQTFAELRGAAASTVADGLAPTLLPLAAARLAGSRGEVALVPSAYTPAWPLVGVTPGISRQSSDGWPEPGA